MKRAYEATLKDGNELKTATVKGYNLIDAIHRLANYINVYDDLLAVYEITFERYHAINIAFAIANADTWEDCKEECAELCRLAGMESEWRGADGETFEAVLIEAAKKLNVEI